MNKKVVIGTIVATFVVILFSTFLILKNTTRQEISSKDLQPSSGSSPFQEGVGTSQLPPLTLTDYNGKQVSFSDFSGLPIVVNAWAAWCPFCTKELADFATVQDQYRDKVVFIAIDRGESLDVAKSFTDKIGVTDKMIFLLDQDDSFYKSIGGFSMPETLFVDATGRIVYHKRGPMDRNEIQERTKALLE